MRHPVSPASIEVFFDGSCLGNPGPGGWGVLLRQGAASRTLSGGEAQTTNNRMELMALIQGLEALPVGSLATVTGDSQYVIKGASEWIKNWRRRNWADVANVDLWQRLDQQLGRHTLTFQWVRGHSGHPENEQVDQLAREAARNAQAIFGRARAV